MIESCPVCRYSLAGLPVRYRCPECGFAYDDRMSIRALDLRLHVVLIGSFAAVFLIQFGFFVYRGGIASVPAISYLMIGYFPVYALYLYRNRRRNKIITWPGGFQFIRKSVPSRAYAWNQIKSFRRSLVDGCAYILLHDGTETRLFGLRFFGTHKSTARFVNEVNQLREEYVRSGQ